MKEYKIIKQTGTAVKSQQNFEEWVLQLVMKLKHRTQLKKHYRHQLHHYRIGRY